METIFLEITLSIIVATIFAVVARVLRQPLILAYILAGVFLGPLVLNLISLPDILNSLSALGVAFLLFLIGLELDVRRLKEIGKTSAIIGAGQILFTAAIAFGVLILLGIDAIPALYASIALTLSSTIIVVKLLSEKRALTSLYGRISIGILLVQDFVAILILIILAGVGDAEGGLFGAAMIFTLAKGAMLFVFTALLSRYILPPIFSYLARSDELLFLASISWAFIFSIFAAAIGFSVEIGAFLAGIALASVPYHLEIAGRVKNLRDFFITMFFVSLGTHLTVAALSTHFGLFVALSFFVLIGNPLIIMIIMGLLGYHRRTAFFTGITVAQISEFSLILMAIGARLGHVSDDMVALVTAIGVVTIALSAYMFAHAERLYRILSPFLRVFQRTKVQEPTELSKELSGHVILVGVHRIGKAILDSLRRTKVPVIVIDFDPQVVRELTKLKIPVMYGDLSDSELLDRVNITEARMIITTVPDVQDNIRLLQNIKRLKLKIPTYLSAFSPLDALDLYEHGAAYVILPHHIAGKHLGLMLESQLMNSGNISVDRAEHIAELKERYGFILKHVQRV
ncbi:MAG: cation:proton antiporter [Patescibacteria group bacterium]|jgi:Kef-type K+ transport system membrane component KefB